MYVLSRFTRFAFDSQIIAAYNYRTGKLITEPCGTNSFEDLEKLRSGTIDQNSPLFQTLLSNGFIVDAQYDELQALKDFGRYGFRKAFLLFFGAAVLRTAVGL